MSKCSQIGRWKEYLGVVFRRRQRVVDTNISDFGSVRKKFSNELSLRGRGVWTPSGKACVVTRYDKPRFKMD